VRRILPNASHSSPEKRPALFEVIAGAPREGKELPAFQKVTILFFPHVLIPGKSKKAVLTSMILSSYISLRVS
jgi:hypothetical protein